MPLHPAGMRAMLRLPEHVQIHHGRRIDFLKLSVLVHNFLGLLGSTLSSRNLHFLTTSMWWRSLSMELLRMFSSETGLRTQLQIESKLLSIARSRCPIRDLISGRIRGKLDRDDFNARTSKNIEPAVSVERSVSNRIRISQE